MNQGGFGPVSLGQGHGEQIGGYLLCRTVLSLGQGLEGLHQLIIEEIVRPLRPKEGLQETLERLPE
jgi:hypothetical protein